MANTVINTPELLNLDSTTGATILAKGTISERPSVPTFNADYLIIAGGGGGGGGRGGNATVWSSGGGGGGYQYNAGIKFLIDTNYTITVGDGGAGGAGNGTPVASGGENSSIVASGIINEVATGGVGGGQSSGASGGNSGSLPSNSGGTSYTAGAYWGAGGGAGAGSNGSNGSNLSGGNGGNGYQSSITGTAAYYGGGGGGGIYAQTGGSGGLGGGGNGKGTTTNGDDGVNNTGGGGGGAGSAGASAGVNFTGGTGGSGVVILRYPNTQTITIGSGLTGTTATVGSDKVTTFTDGTGTITFTDSTPTNPDEYPIDGTLRFNTDTNKTEYYDGTGWYEIVDEYASGFIGPGTNYFDTKLYTGNGSTQSIGGYINGSGSFNGSSSYIDTNYTFPADSSYSISCWFNTSNTSQMTIYSDINSSADSQSSRISLRLMSSGNFGLIIGNSSTSWINESVSSSSYLDGNWHHIVQVVNGTSVKLYADGNTTPIADLTSTVSAGTLGEQSLIFGRLGHYNGQYFNGDIDQVRIYSTALSSSDVTALYNETAATATTAAYPSGQTAIATYTMDTSANGLLTTTDLSTVDYPSGAGCLSLYEMNGNSNDTSNTYNGTPTNITYQGGAFDQAAVFNGSSSYISTNLYQERIGSFSFWMKRDSTPSSPEILVAYNGLSSGFKGFFTQLQTDGDIRLAMNKGTSGTNGLSIYSSGVNTSDGGWHHVAAAWDITTQGSTNSYLYIDGSLNVSGTADDGNWTSGNSSDTYIFGNGSTSNSQVFEGSLDQVRIFNTELTQAQVTTLARGIATSYSGTNTSVNFNGHLDFAPDFVWVKNRDESSYHYLYNTVSQGNLYSDSTAAQDANSVASYGTISPSTNGFGVTRGSNSSSNGLNKNSNDYVSWNWKAGGAAVTNNDGTIAAQVSANKDSGFSIATYTGVGYPNSSTAEIGHGLLQAPELVFIKGTGGTGQSGGAGSWVAGTGVLASNNWAGSMYLNSPAAYYTAVNYFWNGAVTDSVVKLKTDWFVNGNNNQYVMYSWHSVAGYSSIGSYTGNGSTTGTIVTLDFAPSFVMIKGTDQASDWIMIDNRRDTTNPNSARLDANSNGQEYTGENIMDLNTNGFQLKTSSASKNGLNKVFIYMAFA